MTDIRRLTRLNNNQPVTKEEMTTTLESVVETTVETPKGRGIQILEKNGKIMAFLPHNDVKFLDAVYKQNKRPENWDGIEEYKDQSNVFEVGPEIPKKAYPGLQSATTIANSVKKHLDDKNIIKIIKAGGKAVGPAVIHVLVDEYKLKTKATSTKVTSTGRKVGRPKKSETPPIKMVTKVATPGLDMKQLSVYMKLQGNIEVVRKQYPDVYATFIEPHFNKK